MFASCFRTLAIIVVSDFRSFFGVAKCRFLQKELGGPAFAKSVMCWLGRDYICIDHRTTLCLF